MEGQKVLINGDRLKASLEKFADFGRTENNGVTRLALSKEDEEARNYFRSCCEELGMIVSIDDMGNMYALLEGEAEHPPIVMGSHLDSVKKGGRFDGVFGVAAGLEVITTIVDNSIKPRIPLMLVNFTNEEGARFEPSMMASGVITGKFEKEIMMRKKDENGITFEQALKAIGYDGDKKNRLTKATALLEMHIEQGPVLEAENLTIGVVECVVGMVCYEITVSGESNHAGTTPMSMRKDALFAANDIIAEIRKQLGKLDSELVFTIGRMNTYPNIHTVIPNKVIFTVEARHKDPLIMKQVESVLQDLDTSVELEDCSLTAIKLWDRNTVWFDERILEQIEESVKTLGYSYKTMASGAGHDAQFMASVVPTAMIFVPSIKGKSHCEEELTPWEDCEKGVNVLLETVLSLGKQ